MLPRLGVSFEVLQLDCEVVVRQHLDVVVRLLSLHLAFLEVLDVDLVEHGEGELRMIRGLLVLLEVGVDGADVEVRAGGGGPVLDLVDLDFQCLFEIAESHLGLVVSACRAGYFL